MTAIQDQVILVTGSTDGIGKQTDLVSMGATVLLVARGVRERQFQRCKRFMQQLEITNWNIIWRILVACLCAAFGSRSASRINHLN